MFKYHRVEVWRSKVALGYDHDIAQLDHGRNMCGKFKLRLQRSSPNKVADTTHPLDRPGRVQTIPGHCLADSHEWLWGENKKDCASYVLG